MHIPSHLQPDYLREVVPPQQMVCIPRWIHQVVEERVLPLSSYCDLETLSPYVADGDLLDYLLTVSSGYFEQQYNLRTNDCVRYPHPAIHFTHPFTVNQSLDLIGRNRMTEEMLRSGKELEERDFERVMIGRPLQPSEEIVWRVVDLGQRPADPSGSDKGVVDVIGLIAHFVIDTQELDRPASLRFNFHRSLIHCLYNHRVPLEVLAERGLLAGWLNQMSTDHVQHMTPTTH